MHDGIIFPSGVMSWGAKSPIQAARHGLALLLQLVCATLPFASIFLISQLRRVVHFCGQSENVIPLKLRNPRISGLSLTLGGGTARKVNATVPKLGKSGLRR